MLMSMLDAVRIAAALPVYMATISRMTKHHTKVMMRDGMEMTCMGSDAFTTCAPAAVTR